MDHVHPLKAFREKQQPPLSQEDLAALFGVTKPTVSRWETGTRKIDRDLLEIVAGKTGIDPRELRPDLARLFESEHETSQPSTTTS
jgi:transcriptional regulator with XRE-family HTH domain